MAKTLGHLFKIQLMFISEFRQLPDRLKIDLVRKYGHVYSKAEEDKYLFVVYTLFGFYVEVKYDIAEINPEVIRVFAGSVRPEVLVH